MAMNLDILADANRLHDERVALPSPHGVPVVARRDVLECRHLLVQVDASGLRQKLREDHDLLRRLHDLDGIDGTHDGRHALGQTLRARVRQGLSLLVRLSLALVELLVRAGVRLFELRPARRRWGIVGERRVGECGVRIGISFPRAREIRCRAVRRRLSCKQQHCRHHDMPGTPAHPLIVLPLARVTESSSPPGWPLRSG